MNAMTHPIHIRPATQADEQTIQQFVKIGGLPPINLKWPNFLVAEQDGKPVGMGQIREHGGVPELGSLVVLPEYRHQGVASRLVQALEAKSGLPLHLFCERHMETYYARFGYQRIRFWQAPAALRLFALIPFTLPRLMGVEVILMRKV
ncbi:MAG: GNAT family N-acetyltransferase [Burkholderiales bacterium]|nr:GNAT family N-acetyltransferase [Anaerolineae bacterium]